MAGTSGVRLGRDPDCGQRRPQSVFSVGDRFAFDNPQSAEAFEYLVRLIKDDHVAPPASDTNDSGDF